MRIGQERKIMMRKVIVTTSWDDGHRLDSRIIQLLDKYDLKGTFYISKDYLGNNRLGPEEIIELSKKHEIGAHTINHSDLVNISSEKARVEIEQSKAWLESLLNRKVNMFCYPRGAFNEQIIKLVQNSNFKGARTTEEFIIKKPSDFYKIGTTIHIYPFPFRKKDQGHYFWRRLLQPFCQNYSGIRELGIPFSKWKNWLSLAKAVFDITLKTGEIFHLWGHSWEIEKYGMWKELEELLEHISNKKYCIYLTNGQLLKYL